MKKYDYCDVFEALSPLNSLQAIFLTRECNILDIEPKEIMEYLVNNYMDNNYLLFTSSIIFEAFYQIQFRKVKEVILFFAKDLELDEVVSSATVVEDLIDAYIDDIPIIVNNSEAYLDVDEEGCIFNYSAKSITYKEVKKLIQALVKKWDINKDKVKQWIIDNLNTNECLKIKNLKKDAIGAENLISTKTLISLIKDAEVDDNIKFFKAPINKLKLYKDDIVQWIRALSLKHLKALFSIYYENIEEE